MKPEILDALNYFQLATQASAIFIRLPKEIAYLVQNSGEISYGIIPPELLEDTIKSLGECRIEIIAQRGGNGEYVLPDINLLEHEREIDY